MKVEVKLPYIWHWIDHLDRHRYRFRRKGFPGVELPVDSDPASPEFQAAYHAALRGEKVADALAAVAVRGGSGTVNNAIEQYLNSTTFNEYEKTTKAMRRSILKSVSRLVGHLPLAKMDDIWINRWLETAPTKGVQRTRLLALRPFTAWASSPAIKLVDKDPCAGIKVKVKESDGHPTWTDDQIAQFRAHYALGSMARLALELMIAVAARRGDAIALGRQHLRNGWLTYVQEKNRKRKPVPVEVPVPPELAAAIEACPSPPESLTFLTNAWGRPFSKKGFGDWFREQVAAAGLPDTCVPHGLRKASCRIMADSGCTPHEIMAVSGHTTIKEAQRYTSKYDRKGAAVRARANEQFLDKREASGSLTDWTPRAGASSPRSLAHLAARWWLRGTKKMPRLGGAAPGQNTR